MPRATPTTTSTSATARASTTWSAAPRLDLVIHAAAQPSHDLAASRPFDDFDVNAGGTLNLLEACRRHAPDAVFITVSTNKVYGDNPNRLPLVELETRWDYADPALTPRASTRRCRSTAACTRCSARRRWPPTCSPRSTAATSGCAPAPSAAAASPGPHHSGVELHGFLSYLVHTALREGDYTIFGYKGKQVRDQIHSADVISAFWAFAQDPRPGEVVQPRRRQGQRRQPARVRRADRRRQRRQAAPRSPTTTQARVGDHICYYTDMAKFRGHFPAGSRSTTSTPSSTRWWPRSPRQLG